MSYFGRPRLLIAGYLHLAYYTTEITLHRCIVRSLSTGTTDSHLVHICRQAAKSRLLAAIDFTGCLRPEHLRAFWYFCSKVNFSVIGAFGSLLCATAADVEEASYFEELLGKYRWTLRVFHTDIMASAVAMLDAALSRLKTLNTQRLMATAESSFPNQYPIGQTQVGLLASSRTHAGNTGTGGREEELNIDLASDAAHVLGGMFDQPYSPGEPGPSPDTMVSELENAPYGFNGLGNMRF